jgi:hypothetical protein
MTKKASLCAGCRQVKVKITKEHFWPRWLIERTNADVIGVRSFSGKKIPPSALTIPLCEECNNDFGKYLESPVSKIFDEIENGKGVSDFEAELLIRWLWKLEGLYWTFTKPVVSYSPTYKLRERVLLPIDKIRSSLILAISLINQIDPSFGDAPLGLDSRNKVNAIFVAGVFSRIAMMVLFQDFLHMVPPNFSQYRMAEKLDALSDQKTFFPKVGFRNDADAVVTTLETARTLSEVHDIWIGSIQKSLTDKESR